MNGPQYFREAAKCLDVATNADPDASPDDVRLLLQFAQVHATLALVALLVDTHSSRIQPRDHIAEWAEATR